MLCTGGWLDRASASRVATRYSPSPMAAMRLRPSPPSPSSTACTALASSGSSAAPDRRSSLPNVRRPYLLFSCSCVYSDGGSRRGRAWVPLKRARLPSSATTAWSHGSVTGGRRGFRASEPSGDEDKRENLDGVDEEADEREAVESAQNPHVSTSQRVALRRQRTALSGGLPVGDVDLLSIPGVGPRNLRKLVDKGIGGVADLKQLYKDKVRLLLLTLLLP